MTADELRMLPRDQAEKELRKMAQGGQNITQMQAIPSEDEIKKRMEYLKILKENPRFQEASRMPPAPIGNTQILPQTPAQQLPLMPPAQSPISTMPIQSNPANQLDGYRLTAYNDYLARAIPMMATQNNIPPSGFGNQAPSYKFPQNPPIQSPVKMFSSPATATNIRPQRQAINTRSFVRPSFQPTRRF